MEDTLSHYGILGQKWGVRRYQNEDGSLTKAGKDRYSQTSSSKLKSNLTISSELGKVDAVSGAAPKVTGSISSSLKKTNEATVKKTGLFTFQEDKDRARQNMSDALVNNHLGKVEGLSIVERKLENGLIEYKASYYDSSEKRKVEYSIDELEELKKRIEKDALYKAKQYRKRKEIREALDNIEDTVKNAVDKVLSKASAAGTKIKDIAKPALEYGGLVVSEIFKKIMGQ